jgi:hypothetical protein
MMHDTELSRAIQESVARAKQEMTARAPHMAERAWRWIATLCPGQPPQSYFDAEWGYPLFLLPWWLGEMLDPDPDPGFRRDLVYSTVNGYYFIRLLDDVMDADAAADAALLPCAAFFHSRFQAPYQRHFDARHPFWDDWDRQWLAGHEAALRDHHLTSVDRDTFEKVCAAKTAAAKIPVFAVCHHHGRADLIPDWDAYCDLLGRYVQMADDLFDWLGDATTERQTTYLLSEADRRRHPHESRSEWMVREGLEWATRECLRWLSELEAGAERLACAPLVRLVTTRRVALLDEVEATRDSLERLMPLAKYFPSGS